MATNLVTLQKRSGLQIFCKKRDRERESDRYPYKVIEITPPPKNLGIRCFPSCLWSSHKFSAIVISESSYLCSSGRWVSSSLFPLSPYRLRGSLFLCLYFDPNIVNGSLFLIIQHINAFEVVGFDQDKDVAVLRVDALEEKLRPIPVGISADLLVGQKVYANGNPLTQKDSSETGNQETAEERRLIEGLLDGSGEYTLVYEDTEGDRMLVGDVL